MVINKGIKSSLLFWWLLLILFLNCNRESVSKCFHSKAAMLHFQQDGERGGSRKGSSNIISGFPAPAWLPPKYAIWKPAPTLIPLALSSQCSSTSISASGIHRLPKLSFYLTELQSHSSSWNWKWPLEVLAQACPGLCLDSFWITLKLPQILCIEIPCPAIAEPPTLCSFPTSGSPQFPFPLMPPPHPNILPQGPATFPCPLLSILLPPAPRVHLCEDPLPFLQSLPIPEVSSSWPQTQQMIKINIINPILPVLTKTSAGTNSCSYLLDVMLAFGPLPISPPTAGFSVQPFSLTRDPWDVPVCAGFGSIPQATGCWPPAPASASQTGLFHSCGDSCLGSWQRFPKSRQEL